MEDVGTRRLINIFFLVEIMCNSDVLDIDCNLRSLPFQAYYARDALAKNLYIRLFSWLVNRINESIKVCLSVFSLNRCCLLKNHSHSNTISAPL